MRKYYKERGLVSRPDRGCRTLRGPQHQSAERVRVREPQGGVECEGHYGQHPEHREPQGPEKEVKLHLPNPPEPVQERLRELECEI